MKYKTKRKDYLHTIEETFVFKGSKFASDCNNNPLHETIASARIFIFLIKLI